MSDTVAERWAAYAVRIASGWQVTFCILAAVLSAVAYVRHELAVSAFSVGMMSMGALLCWERLGHRRRVIAYEKRLADLEVQRVSGRAHE